MNNTTIKTFYFDTGVKPIDTSWRPHHSGTREIPLCKGQVWRNGTKQIPFDCEDVPDGATFAFACDYPDMKGYEGFIIRQIHNSTLISKYAYFKPSK